MKQKLYEVPFSRRGSYLALSYDQKEGQLWLRDVRGGDESPSRLFQLVLSYQGQTLDIYSEETQAEFQLTLSATQLTLVHRAQPEVCLTIIFPTENQLRIKQQQIGLTLIADKIRYDSLNPLSDQRFEYISYKKEARYQIDFRTPEFTYVAPWEKVGNTEIKLQLPEENLQQEILFTDYRVVSPVIAPFQTTFEEAAEQVAQEYQAWQARFQPALPSYEDSNNLAQYILWSSIVRPEGLLTGESIYMSKNWMQNIWSWDNCFNALGVATNEAALAYNQMALFCQYQDPSGAYPDFINTQFYSFNCVKPPIHAWAYQKLMQQAPFFTEEAHLRTMYESIRQATLFWLNHRRCPQTGLCYYTHGNDSGWDNASIFHEGLPVIAPDLQAYLIQQMDLLANWAQKLNRPAEQNRWQAEADALTTLLLKELYDEQTGQFVAKSLRTGAVIAQKQSLILRLPLVIASRLPKEIVANLVRDLANQFEGAFGLATEAPSSPLYKNNGYWLGPIWAPSSYLFVDALLRCGEEDFAIRLAKKYCEMTLIGGMAENYNPETGKGNDDLSFTWTSSVFLQMQTLLAQKMRASQ